MPMITVWITRSVQEKRLVQVCPDCQGKGWIQLIKRGIQKCQRCKPYVWRKK